MFKLIKYEYRKDLPLYIVLFAAIFALELYALLSILSESELNMSISFALYILGGLAGMLFILIMGAVSYSKEINSKFSYMTFMTPRSTYQIVGSKYLSIFMATVVATILYILFAYIDVTLICLHFEDVKNVAEMLDLVLDAMGMDLSGAVMSLLAALLVQWINIFFIISCSYLAITLSATVLSNRKGKTPLALLFFIVIIIIANIIRSKLPTFDYGDSIIAYIFNSWTEILFEFAMIGGTYFGVSALLKHKVSL